MEAFASTSSVNSSEGRGWTSATAPTSASPAPGSADQHDAARTPTPSPAATEIAVPDGMPRVLRLLAHVETTRSRADIRHTYLRGAVTLQQPSILYISGVALLIGEFELNDRVGENWLT